MKPYWFIFVLVMAMAAVVGKNPASFFEGNPVCFLLGVLGISDYFAAPMPVAVWWYMCFAQILLLLIPFIAELCRNFGILVLGISVLSIPFLGSEGIVSQFGGSYINYLFVIILGVLCAQNKWLDLLGRRSEHWYLRLFELVLLVGIIIGCIYLNYRYSSVDAFKLTKLLLALAAALISLVVYKYCTNCVVETVLSFLGRHAGNIFLLHAFAYTYYPQLVYWSHNAVLSWLTLMLGSLGASIVVEAMKSLMRKNSRLQWLV